MHIFRVVRLAIVLGIILFSLCLLQGRDKYENTVHVVSSLIYSGRMLFYDRWILRKISGLVSTMVDRAGLRKFSINNRN